MTKDEQAKKSLILTLLAGYRSSAKSADEATVAVYLSTLEPYRADAVAHAVKRFLAGDVEGHDNSFAPTVPELAKQARLFHDVLNSIDERRANKAVGNIVSLPIGTPLPEGFVSIGPMKVDFGHGPIDMSNMTPAEKERVLTSKQRPGQQRLPFSAALKRMGWPTNER